MMSRKAVTPFVVAWPRWSTLTLIVTGTPWSGPLGVSLASSAAASAQAVSARLSTTALSCGLMASIRSMAASVTSSAVISPARVAREISVAVHCQSGVSSVFMFRSPVDHLAEDRPLRPARRL
jgi:hypothetical protein